MNPSMSIGRNYRLELEKRLRKINQTRENTLSLKILDEHGHLLKPPISLCSKKRKSNDEFNIKIKKNNKSSDGVVPLVVNKILYFI